MLVEFMSCSCIFVIEPSTAIEILDELRLSLLENNFSVSATLLKWLSNSSSRLFLPVIWKVSVTFSPCNLYIDKVSYNLIIRELVKVDSLLISIYNFTITFVNGSILHSNSQFKYKISTCYRKWNMLSQVMYTLVPNLLK